MQLVLVGNNCEKNNERVVSIQQGQELANEFGIQFFESSPAENLNIEAPFMALVEAIKLHGTPSTFDQSQRIGLSSEENARGGVCT